MEQSDIIQVEKEFWIFESHSLEFEGTGSRKYGLENCCRSHRYCFSSQENLADNVCYYLYLYFIYLFTLVTHLTIRLLSLL